MNFTATSGSKLQGYKFFFSGATRFLLIFQKKWGSIPVFISFKILSIFLHNIILKSASEWGALLLKKETAVMKITKIKAGESPLFING
ncbi:MAG: hypothetical protein IJA70_01610 [Oscillospiraceae bacterium]|nr:hypothetical protein [Oscillospiraceae bacterium]